MNVEARSQQPVVLPSVPAELREAYDEILLRPKDLNALWAMAREAESRGLDEFAIRLYERMLIVDDRLAQPRLRLAQLHYERGALLLARTYLEEALADPALPDDIRQTAAGYLQEIDSRLSRHRLLGNVRLGLRYATNPAAVTDFLEESAGGVGSGARGQTDKRSDESVYAALDLTHDYDLLTQSGDSLETNAYLYGEKYRRTNDTNFALLDLDSGPRMVVGSPGNERTWRPYAVGRLLGIENSLYSAEAGGGVETRVPVSGNAAAFGSLELTYAWHRNYNIGGDENDNSTGSEQKHDDRDGLRLNGELGLNAAILPQLQATVAAYGGANDAREDLRENDLIGVRSALQAGFDAPLDLTVEPWTGIVGGSLSYRRFGRDSALDERRTETRWRAFLSLVVPIARSWGLEFGAAHSDLDSSIDGGDYDNSEFSIGLVYAFGSGHHD